MYKYLLIISHQNIPYIHYFNDLIGIYQFVCDDLSHENFDIFDYDDDHKSILERIDEHETSYYIFEMGKEKSFFSIDPDDIFTNTWSKFQSLCFKKTESIQVKNCSNFLLESKKDKFPNIKKVEIDGFIVYIGKDAKSNDHLTFNISTDNDIWMHAKGVPGSHVLIRVRDILPTREVIFKVAKLAAKNSKSISDQTKVVYCKSKFVKKEKNMNPGQVKIDYANAQEIIV